jgi:sporulation protein YlmC with PRC-barrel domain
MRNGPRSRKLQIAMRIEMGARVRCTDDVLGELADVVIDPTRKRVTHLVVQPHHQHGMARLVPVELAGAGGEQGEIALHCTVEDVYGLTPVQEFAYLRLGEFPVDDPNWDVGVSDVLAMPYYEAGYGPSNITADTGVIYDRVPKGAVEIRRASSVSSADGHHLGHVDGFLVDDEQITHVVLERGHLWGKRDIAIPIGAVTEVETDAITVRLSKDDVGALADVSVRRWPG